RLVLPETEHEPARFFQDLVGLAVPLNVPGNLFRPVSRISFRRHIVLWTALPIAAFYEQRDLRRTKHHVSRPAKVWQRTCRDPVPQSCGVHEAPDQDLRPRVAATDGLHIAAAGCGGSPRTFWSLPFTFGGHTAEGNPKLLAARRRLSGLLCGSRAPRHRSAPGQRRRLVPLPGQRAAALWGRPRCVP